MVLFTGENVEKVFESQKKYIIGSLKEMHEPHASEAKQVFDLISKCRLTAPSININKLNLNFILKMNMVQDLNQK